MVDDLRNGGTLSEVAGKHPEAFPNYYIGIMQSAELTGNLDGTLESLAGYLERELETRSKVVSALSYPGVVMAMAMVTVVILAGYVLPQFKPLFAELNADLPLTDSQPAVHRHAVQHAVVHPVQRASARSSGAMYWLFKTDSGKTGQRPVGAANPGRQGHRRVRHPRAVLPHPRRHGQSRCARCPTA